MANPLSMNQTKPTPQPLPFSWIGGSTCLDFANTVSWHSDGLREERLQSFSDLIQWGGEAETLSSEATITLTAESKRNPTKAAAALSDALDVRQLIHSIFSEVAREEQVSRVNLGAFNARLIDALKVTEIAPADNRSRKFGRSWALHRADLDQVIRPVLVDASDLLLSGELEKVRTCANDQCGWLFLDKSRNHLRRWCEMRACGNRAKARRHAAKKG